MSVDGRVCRLHRLQPSAAVFRAFLTLLCTSMLLLMLLLMILSPTEGAEESAVGGLSDAGDCFQRRSSIPP
uniref:Uncharacterized protein n=1 Tax=Chromera velia CCMP2878 TaxID=1169474 RepID=A0A0G4HHC7_9ALVE|eukprot:Cvel_6865.t1-p1 / transcript=Cvel_6865.t1 / gene=Cvel_6865 / organism=Chromera_velia_CCMP2878 / gene_product=hypothetical protein / transcript_product=hypothetical protein / location=Cvel_scaffold347:5628-5837(+) / protein_length=70 / sequence_SO=supercontig / SO=protein_coding / is_pseudo=false